MRPPSHHERRYWIAALICERFRAMRREEGTQVAARRLRKSGIARDPIVALRILGITPSPPSGRPSGPERLEPPR